MINWKIDWKNPRHKVNFLCFRRVWEIEGLGEKGQLKTLHTWGAHSMTDCLSEAQGSQNIYL